MTAELTTKPQDYHTVTPYLIIDGAAEAITFYQQAFAATELMRITMRDGLIGFAELKIGDSLVLLSDEFPEISAYSPISLKGTPVRIHLYVDNVDQLVMQALKFGAQLIRPIQAQFFGDRAAVIQDPFGHLWSIATRVENISRQEMLKRFETMLPS